jgi:hypothetical protein
MIGLVTAMVTLFIRLVYYRPSPEPLNIGFQFLIASLVYIFAIVLLIRQHVGLYPEYFITAGTTGLALRKASYRHVVDYGVRAESGREVQLEVEMRTNERLVIHLPAQHVRTFRELVEKQQPEL